MKKQMYRLPQAGAAGTPAWPALLFREEVAGV